MYLKVYFEFYLQCICLRRYEILTNSLQWKMLMPHQYIHSIIQVLYGCQKLANLLGHRKQYDEVLSSFRCFTVKAPFNFIMSLIKLFFSWSFFSWINYFYIGKYITVFNFSEKNRNLRLIDWIIDWLVFNINFSSISWSCSE